MALYLFRNETSSPDITNLGYFHINERDFTTYPGPPVGGWGDGTFEPMADPGTPVYEFQGLTFKIGWIREAQSSLPLLVSATSGPNIWPSVDRLAKSFQSTILTRLGQITSQPNILT